MQEGHSVQMLILRFAFVFSMVAVLSLPLSGPAGADELAGQAGYGEEAMLFQEIPSVYGASKYEQKVTEAPSSVSIITSSEIKKYGYRTLADILRSVRSFYITYDRNYSYVGVRGFGRPGDYNSRILLLIDGHRTNDNIFNQAFVGAEAIIDVDLIERVEVIRGPGSSLYGSNAFFAVVNVITRRGRNLKGAEVSAEAGSFEAYAARLSYGNRFQNGLELIVSGTGHDSKGDRLYFSEFDPASSTDPRAANGGFADRADYDRHRSFFTKAALQDFTFEGAYSSRSKGIPTGAFGTDFNDPGNKTIDTRSYVDLKYERNLSSRTDVSARLFYDYYAYTGDYLYATILNRDQSYGEWWGSEVKLVSRLFDAHRVIIGGEYVDNMRQDQKNYDVATSTSYLDDARGSRIWAAYLQDEFALVTKVTVNAGVRYDHYDTFGGTTNPRLALIYTPFDKGSFKLLYGSAFRAPNDYELYYVSPTSTPPMAANPDLKPETIRTYTLVYEQYFGDHFHAAVSGYYYTIQDLIDQTTDLSGNSVFKNIDEVEARGLEWEVENRWPNGLEGRFSYTIQTTEDKLTGDPLTNSPAQLAKLNLAAPIMKDNVSAGIEELYMSRRKTLSGASTENVYITNLTLFTQNLASRLEASASIYNLFDKKYGDPVSADLLPLDMVLQDGRTYRLKVTYAF